MRTIASCSRFASATAAIPWCWSCSASCLSTRDLILHEGSLWATGDNSWEPHLNPHQKKKKRKKRERERKKSRQYSQVRLYVGGSLPVISAYDSSSNFPSGTFTNVLFTAPTSSKGRHICRYISSSLLLSSLSSRRHAMRRASRKINCAYRSFGGGA